MPDRPTQFSKTISDEMNQVCKMEPGPEKDKAWKTIMVRIGDHYKPRKGK